MSAAPAPRTDLTQCIPLSALSPTAESLTPAAKERAVSQSLHSKVVGLEGITASLRVVTRSSLLARLAALMAISGMIFECLKCAPRLHCCDRPNAAWLADKMSSIMIITRGCW